MALVDLYNRAISSCGGAANIADPDENSREAALCRTWFPFVRDMVMGAASWPSLKAYSRLARLSTQPADSWVPGSPAPGFQYSYAEPDNMLRPLYMQSYNRFAWSGNAIHSSEPEPILFFLKRQSDLSLWDLDLLSAVTFALAAQIAIPLTGRSTRLQENVQLAEMRIEAAQSMAANSEYVPEEDLPDWLQVRGGTVVQDNRFFYPLTSFNLATSQT